MTLMVEEETWTSFLSFSWSYWLFPVFSIFSLGLLWVFYSTCKVYLSRRNSFPSQFPLPKAIPGVTVKTRDLTVSLHYLHFQDFPVLYEMERLYGGNLYPCNYQKFCDTLTNGQTVGVVAKDQDGRIHGYLVFAIREEDVFIGSLIVSPSFRRHGLGSAMMEWLLEKLPPELLRPRVIVYAREGQLAWQTFLKKHGFTCTMILDDLFISPEENGYFFERLFASLSVR